MSVLRSFSQKMVDSGYEADIRKEILVSGVRRYFRLRLNHEAGIRNLYRTPEEMKSARERKSTSARAWFKGFSLEEKVAGGGQDDRRSNGKSISKVC